MIHRQIFPPNPSFFALYSLPAAAGVLVRIRLQVKRALRPVSSQNVNCLRPVPRHFFK
jgi:hypothetical protein